MSISVDCLIMLQNGQFAAAFGTSIKILSHYSSDYRCIKHIERAHENNISCFAMLINDQFASGSDDETINIWECHEYKCMKRIYNEGFGVNNFLMLLSGRFVSSCGSSINIWSCYEDFNLVRKIWYAHEKTVLCFIMFLNDYNFASGSADGAIAVWECEHFNRVEYLKHAHDDGVLSFLMLPNYSLASGSQDGVIKIWNILTFNCMKVISCNRNSSIVAHCMVTNSNYTFITGLADGRISMWNYFNDYECIEHVENAHGNRVKSFLALPNELLASGSEDGTLRIWNTGDFNTFLKQID